MEGLDQGHLNPKLEVLRLTFLVRESNPGLRKWEASTLAKNYPNSVLIAIQNIYTLARDKNEKIQCVKEETGRFFKVEYL
jgi:hypothetical protein